MAAYTDPFVRNDSDYLSPQHLTWRRNAVGQPHREALPKPVCPGLYLPAGRAPQSRNARTNADFQHVYFVGLVHSCQSLVSGTTTRGPGTEDSPSQSG